MRRIYSRSGRWCCELTKSVLTLEAGFDLLILESLLGFAHCAQRRTEYPRSLTTGGLGVLLRLGGSSLDGFLSRVVDDHAPRSNFDLVLRGGHVVARLRLEHLPFAGRSPLHCDDSVTACLRIPDRGSPGLWSVFHAIEEAYLLRGTQSVNLGHERGFFVSLGFLQTQHGLFQPFLGRELVCGFVLAHLPVNFPPAPGILRVEHFAFGVGDIALDQFLPEGSRVLCDVRAGDFDFAELGWVVDTSKDGLYGMVGQVGDVGYAGDVADGGVLGHG